MPVLDGERVGDPAGAGFAGGFGGEDAVLAEDQELGLAEGVDALADEQVGLEDDQAAVDADEARVHLEALERLELAAVDEALALDRRVDAQLRQRRQAR